MSSLHEKTYRFGETEIKIESPAFNETEKLALFSAVSSGLPDLYVRVEVSGRIVPPDLPCIRKNDTEFFYSGDTAVSVVRSGADGRILWMTTSRGSRISAEIAPDREASLNTYELLRICDLPAVFLRKHSVILHASFSVINGSAILFTGEKQAGKSTQAALWERYKGAETINGDRALLEKKDGVWYATGLPFCGTSGICRKGSWPVRAVVMLSKGKTNHACPADGREILRHLLAQCSYESSSREQLTNVLNIAEELAGEARFVKYSCLPEISAVDDLDAYLRSVSNGE